MSQIQIRTGTSKDIPFLIEMIKNLAEYEKEPHAAKATEEDLQKYGFGETPLFQTLIGEIDGHSKGMAIYFFTWSTWTGRPTLFLEDLYVDPSSRKLGLGFQLFQRLGEIALEKNCARFEWSVLDWNQLARNFYHKLGAEHRQGWLPYRLEGNSLKNLAKDNT